MQGSEGLAYDDLQSDSDATVIGVDSPQGPALSLHDEATNPQPHTPRHVVLSMPGSPMDHMPPLEAAITSGDAVEVHVDEAKLETSEPEARRQASYAVGDMLLKNVNILLDLL